MKKVLLAPLLAAFLCTVIAVIGFVPTSSMAPTIRPGGLFVGCRIFDPNHIEHNDIIIFPHDGFQYLKRVIGLPGDLVTFRDGEVHVNNEPVAADYQTRGETTSTQMDYLVPEGEVFVLGDNRQNSYDSRYWDYPYVPMDDITAKCILYCNLPGFIYNMLSPYSGPQIIKGLQIITLIGGMLIISFLAAERHSARCKEELLTYPLILTTVFFCAVMVVKLQSFLCFWNS